MTRQEAIEYLELIKLHDAPKLREAIDMAIKSLETVKGEWEVIDYAEPRRYVCSICHIGLGWHTTNYCPNCGAEMRGEQDDRN